MCRIVAVERDIGSYRMVAMPNSEAIRLKKEVKEISQKVKIQQEGGHENG